LRHRPSVYDFMTGEMQHSSCPKVININFVRWNNVVQGGTKKSAAEFCCGCIQPLRELNIVYTPFVGLVGHCYVLCKMWCKISQRRRRVPGLIPQLSTVGRVAYAVIRLVTLECTRGVTTADVAL